jgi:uncharacterized membrane protein YphA (DoxX/SURF4 family)
MQLLQHGFGLVPVALAINRITVGTFFVLSGYQKLFKPSRHNELVSTLQADGVHGIRIMQWLIHRRRSCSVDGVLSRRARRV